MVTYIPAKETKKYSAQGQGDLFGNLVRSRNLDFNKKGYLSLAKKPVVAYTKTQDANFRAPVCITSDDSNYFVLTSDNAFQIDGTFGINEITAGSPPTFGFQSDGVSFNGDVHASGTTMVCSYNTAGGTWTSRITGLSSAYPHPLCVSEHQASLAVGNGPAVKLYTAAYALTTTLVIPSDHVVEWIRWRANLLYIGTRNIVGGDAKMYLWNGSGVAVQAGYGVAADWIYSGCEYDSTIAIVTSAGQLLKFAGDGFVPIRTDDGTIMNFPIYYEGFNWTSSASTSNLVGQIASRGMAAKGRRIFMMVDGTVSTSGGQPTQLVQMPSGLWVMDPEVGLYHKGGLDHKIGSTLQPTALASDTLTLPSAVVFETGDPVGVKTILGVTGLSSGRTYYAIKTDSTHLKLARTPAEAVAGVAITLGGTPGVSDLFRFQSYQSVGATHIERSGGLAIMTKLGFNIFLGSEVIYGGETATSLGATVGTVMSLGLGKNVGSFTTPKVQAASVTDIFKKLIAKFPPLNIASRKILIKYRIANRWGVPGRRGFGSSTNSVTWVSSTSFSISSLAYDMYAVAVGDEVEFTEGSGAGYTAHITAIDKSTSTYVVTIDETMPDVVAADTSDAIFDNWTKYKTISTVADAKAAAKGFKNMALTKNAKWVQFKIELRGYPDIEDSIDMEELAILNGADQKYA